MFLLRLIPVRDDQRCEKGIGLNKAGKPRSCHTKGYVKLIGGGGEEVAICRRHFDAAKSDLEAACMDAAGL